MASTSQLRILAALLFIPAFPLCLAHGILRQYPVPAMGLIPQFFSVVAAVVVVGLRREKNSEEHHPYGIRDVVTHPFAVFTYDLALATAYMLVLVFTWMSNGGPYWITNNRPYELSMLAAYATMPLLASFFIHMFLALQAVYNGLGMHRLIQWVACRTLPPNCPNCNKRLRMSLPTFAWPESFRRRTDGYAAIPAMEGDRYRDDVDEEDVLAPREPEAADIKGKGKTADAAADDSSWQE